MMKPIGEIGHSERCIISPSNFGRVFTKQFFEGEGEMGKIFETKIEVNIGWAFSLFIDQKKSFLQPALNQPFTWAGVENGFEISFESGETSTRHIRKTFNAGIKTEIVKHKLFQIDFIRFAKVEENGFKFGVNLE